MLVLSRKKGQSILIGDNIELVVVSIEGDQVKIGINAPNDIKVYRKEVLDAIRESNRAAVASKKSLKQLQEISKVSLDNFMQKDTKE